MPQDGFDLVIHHCDSSMTLVKYLLEAEKDMRVMRYTYLCLECKAYAHITTAVPKNRMLTS